MTSAGDIPTARAMEDDVMDFDMFVSPRDVLVTGRDSVEPTKLEVSESGLQFKFKKMVKKAAERDKLRGLQELLENFEKHVLSEQTAADMAEAADMIMWALPSSVTKPVMLAAWDLASHFAIHGVGDGHRCHGLAIIVGDAPLLMSLDEDGYALFGGPVIASPFESEEISILAPEITKDKRVIDAFKLDGAIVVDGKSGRIVCAAYFVGNSLGGSTKAGVGHRAASAIAQQADGCFVVKGSNHVTRKGKGELDVFIREAEGKVALDSATVLSEIGRIGMNVSAAHVQEEPFLEELDDFDHLRRAGGGLNLATKIGGLEFWLPPHIGTDVAQAMMKLARHVAVVGVGKGTRANGFTLLAGDEELLLKKSASGQDLYGGSASHNFFVDVDISILDEGIESNPTLIAAFKSRGSIVIDGITGKLVTMDWYVGNITKGSRDGTSRHRAASAIAQQAGSCFVIKASKEVTQVGNGELDIFLGKQEEKEKVHASVEEKFEHLRNAYMGLDYLHQAAAKGDVEHYRCFLKQRPVQQTSR